MNAEQKHAVTLIEGGREDREMSIREAAGRAGIHESYWRQIVAGGVHQGGVWVARNPTKRTLLAMARAVGVELEVRAAMGEKTPRRRRPGIDIAQADFDEIIRAATATGSIDLGLLRAWADRHRATIGEDDYRAYIAYIARQEQIWELDRAKVVEDLRHLAS